MTAAAQDGLAVTERAVVAATVALEAACDELCRLDSAAGDGDHGLAMAAAARGIRGELSDHLPADLASLLAAAAHQLAAVGGSMGALSYVLVQALVETVAGRSGPLTVAEIAGLLAASEDAVSGFGGAQRGDKTIVDAIAAARAAAEECARLGMPVAETLLRAAAAAQEGTDATAAMVARIGRASRLGERSRGTVDPGARSFAIVLGALAGAYASEVDACYGESAGARSNGGQS